MELGADVPTFPQYLHGAGYRTAFIGKWHMDATRDSPRPGFDHWVSFRGQGVYDDPTMNVNGTVTKRSGYVTDLLTDYAVDWLNQKASEPFLLILSHKAPHAPFQPAPRHAGTFANASLPEPRNFEDTLADKPSWQRRYVRCGGSVAAFTECPDPQPLDLPPTPCRTTCRGWSTTCGRCSVSTRAWAASSPPSTAAAGAAPRTSCS